MLHEAVAQWSADATRFALADAGDSLEDANFERDTADNAILRLTTEEEFVKSTLEEIAAGKLRAGELSYADRVFQARMNVCVRDAAAHFDGMRFREALKSAFYEMLLARDSYRDMCLKVDTVRWVALAPQQLTRAAFSSMPFPEDDPVADPPAAAGASRTR